MIDDGVLKRQRQAIEDRDKPPAPPPVCAGCGGALSPNARGRLCVECYRKRLALEKLQREEDEERDRRRAARALINRGLDRFAKDRT